MNCIRGYTSSNICNSSKKKTVADVERVGNSLLVTFTDKTTKLLPLTLCDKTQQGTTVNDKTVNFLNATGKVLVATVLIP